MRRVNGTGALMPAGVGRLAGALIVAVILLAGCTGEAETAVQPTPLRPFNDTDVAFAQHIIAADESALALATIALSRAHDPAVRRLAGEILTEQADDVEILAGWLRTWQRPVPTGSPAPLPRPSATQRSATSAVTPGPDPAQVRQLQGPDFDRAFLRMMLANHQWTVEVAGVAQLDGMNPQVRELADELHASRTARIPQLRSLLGPPTPTPS